MMDGHVWFVLGIVIIAGCLLVKALFTVERTNQQIKDVEMIIDKIDYLISGYQSENLYPPFKQDSIILIKNLQELKKLAESDPIYVNHEVMALEGSFQKIHRLDYQRKMLQVYGMDFWIPFDCVRLEKE